MKEFKREKIWEEKYIFGDSERDETVRTMAEAMGVSELFAVLLYNRGFDTASKAEAFLRLEDGNLHDPYLFADMQKAVDRILAAVEQKEKIYILIG